MVLVLVLLNLLQISRFPHYIRGILEPRVGIMIDCNFIWNELGKYVGDVNCIEYEIEICHKYLKIPE